MDTSYQSTEMLTWLTSCTQNYPKIAIRLKIETQFLHKLPKNKSMLTKYKLCYGFILFGSKIFLMVNYLKIGFQLLNVHMWQAALCTLQTAHCTLHTGPAHYTLHQHMIMHKSLHLYISYYTLNNTHCTLHKVHFP